MTYVQPPRVEDQALNRLVNRLVNSARCIWLLVKNFAKEHDDFMASAVIDQRDKILSNHRSVQDQLRKTFGCGCRLLVRGVDMRLDSDMIKGLAIPKVKLNMRPMVWQTRVDAPTVGALIDTEQGLGDQTIHPRGRSGVPSPSSAARVGFHPVDIGSNDVGFHAIAIDRFLSIRMRQWIDQSE